jgi:hypothetical protein
MFFLALLVSWAILTYGTESAPSSFMLVDRINVRIYAVYFFSLIFYFTLKLLFRSSTAHQQSIIANRVFSTPDGQQTTFTGINSIGMMYFFLASTLV